MLLVAMLGTALATPSAADAVGRKFSDEPLGLADIRKLMRDRPQLTFKLVVDSCFSGRWTRAMAERNLRITLTSSTASEFTWLAVTHPRRGRFRNGRFEYFGPVRGEPTAPDAPAPFTNGVVEAVDAWAASAEERAKGEELGQALSYAGEHREGDRAHDLGWQHGRTDDRVDERPHAGEAPAGPPATSVSVTDRGLGEYRVAIVANRPILDGTSIETSAGFQFTGDFGIENCAAFTDSATKITCDRAKRTTRIAFVHRLDATPAPGQRYGTARVVLDGGTVSLGALELR